MRSRTGIAATIGVVVAVLAAGLITWQPWSDDPGPCTIVSADELDDTVVAGMGWLERALQDDGSFWYEYDRTADEFVPGYNHVRHAGTLMALSQVAADGGEMAETATELIDGGLGFVLDQLVTADDRTAFVEPGTPAKLGSTALVVATLAHLRIATGDDTHDDLLRSMGRFMQSLLRDDGGMWAEATGPDLEPRVGTTSTFYTGEAFWALALLANVLPGEGWEESAEAVGYYIATARDEEEDIRIRPHADQWAAYGFSEMRNWDVLEGEELGYIIALIDRYHSRLKTEIGREENRVGDGSGEPDETVTQSRGAGFGTTVEALGSLWRLSAVDPGLSELESRLRQETLCGASILAARQLDAERAATFASPERVEGAWFYLEDERAGLEGHFLTRVDDQQHAISGVLRAIPAHG